MANHTPNIIMVNANQNESFDEAYSYKNILKKYFISKWYWYLLGAFVGVMAAHFFIKTIAPLYSIQSKILIKEKDKSYLPDEDWLKRNLLLSKASENLANEIQVLSSFALMYEVVKELDLKARYFWVKGLSQYEGYKNYPILADTFKVNPPYDNQFEIIPAGKDSFDLLQEKIIGRYAYGELFSNAYGTFKFDKRYGQEEILASEYALRVVLSSYEAEASSVLGRFAVYFADPKENSSILQLALQDPLPNRGMDILNKLTEKYGQLKDKESNAIAHKTLEFINERLSDIRKELEQAEINVERYKLQNDIAAETTSDLEITVQKANSLLDERRNIMAEIEVVQSMQDQLDFEDDNFKLIPVNLSLVNTQIQEVIKPYNSMVLERKKLLRAAKADNPVVKDNTVSLREMRSGIYSALENMEKDLQVKLSMIENQYTEFKGKLKSMPTKERQLLDRSRKQSITEGLYVYLLQKKEETALALVSNISNINVVDPPRSSQTPVSPNTKLLYMAGLIAGLGVPFLFVMGVDFLRESVQSESEIKKIIPHTNVIGFIGQHPGKEKQIVLRQRKALTSEHFRTLRTNLQFQYPGSSKSIMVSSVSGNEGKSFIALNLATSYALAKKKTIIIDFDLHKPDLSEYLEEQSDVGLSDFLYESNTIEELIQSSSAVPNLDFILSGPVPHNPGEVITGHKLTALFDYLNAEYDVIIIDTPPIGIISDAIWLNEHVTNTLLVVRAGHTKVETLNRAKDLIDKKLLNNPALLLNGVKKKGIYKQMYKSYIG